MGIQRQIKRSIIANAMISIVLIAIIVSGIMIAFFMTYQNTVYGKMSIFFREHNIEPGEIKEFIEVDIIELFQGNNRAPLLPVICFVTIVVVVSVSALFSHLISILILKPLKQLEFAAKHIAEGDLDYMITYSTDNEFDSVKNAFNEMQDKLKISIKENIRQEQSKKELIAGISHDLRTPLTSIKGYVHGLQDGVASTPEKLYRYLDTISAKTAEMEVMIDKLFLFSKLDMGDEPIHREPVELNAYIKGYVDTVKEDMAQRGLEVTFIPDAKLDYMVIDVDCDQMSRVFANILENSAKYKVKDTGHVEISIKAVGERCTISFSDDGPGVPNEQIEKMFDSFYRGDPSRNSNIKGSGLGLAIAERIVRTHEGSVAARNNNGLTVDIHLPLKEDKTH